MSNWAEDANKQEKDQRNEILLNRLKEVRVAETSPGSSERPPMGGIGRGSPVNKTTSNVGYSNGTADGSGDSSSKDPTQFGNFKGFVGASLKQQFGSGDSSPSAKRENGSSFGGFGGSGDSKSSSKSGFGGGYGSSSGGSFGGGFGDSSSFGGGNARKNTSSGAGFSNASETTPVADEQDAGDAEKFDKEDESYLNKILHDKLVNITQNVTIERKNPNSPLFSIKSFEELHLRDELLQGVSAMGFSFPSKIQEAALPALVAEPPQNMIAQSQSGTGKTAAFVLCMLSRVDPAAKHPQCLCLAPTYELALQIGKVVETMGQFCKDIKVAYAVRGGTRGRRNETLPQQIIIGTPGTAIDWIVKYQFFDPKLIKVFVLDEADVMISQQGHRDQSTRVHQHLSEECQRLLFSATYDEDVMEFANTFITDPVVITVRREELPLDNIRQYYVDCRNQDDKFRALCNLYGSLTISQSMIFCHTKKTANWLASEMSRKGHAVALLSSDLDIEQRANIIRRFKNGDERVLISTNVCARGIDVEQVTVVINFDLPMTVDHRPDYDTYLHRIGRTGRFGKQGLAVNFIDGPRTRAMLQEIENYFNKKIEKLDTEDADHLERIENRT